MCSYIVVLQVVCKILTLLLNSYVICVFRNQHFNNIFLRKAAELVYIARLYYSNACHCISCYPMAKVLHMPKTEFNYMV